MLLVKNFSLCLKFLIKNFCDICNNLYSCEVSLLIVSGGENQNGFVKSIECYDQKSNKWKEVAKTNEKFVRQVIVSYQPCVPDTCEHFPF